MINSGIPIFRIFTEIFAPLTEHQTDRLGNAHKTIQAQDDDDDDDNDDDDDDDNSDDSNDVNDRSEKQSKLKREKLKKKKERLKGTKIKLKTGKTRVPGLIKLFSCSTQLSMKL